jgi:ABC-type branched-subunit amino acid transport system ATPase component
MRSRIVIALLIGRNSAGKVSLLPGSLSHGIDTNLGGLLLQKSLRAELCV